MELDLTHLISSVLSTRLGTKHASNKCPVTLNSGTVYSPLVEKEYCIINKLLETPELQRNYLQCQWYISSAFNANTVKAMYGCLVPLGGCMALITPRPGIQ